MKKTRKFRLYIDFPSREAMRDWVEHTRNARLIPRDSALIEACPTEEGRADFALRRVPPTS